MNDKLKQVREALEIVLTDVEWRLDSPTKRVVKQALLTLQGETLVDEERLEVVLKRSCPPHRKDLYKPCTLMIDCTECRRAYLTKEDSDE